MATVGEIEYQGRLVKKIKRMFPGCHVMRNDPRLTQGIPDILILWHRTWAMLEIKKSESSRRRPNQEHYVEHFDEMSFAAIICPENEEEVFDALQRTFEAARQACVP